MSMTRRDQDDVPVGDASSAEARRLETLREYRILDTPADLAFDRVTRLVARLFDVPIALISLLDAERQWFKSIHGYSSIGTSRAISFCRHIVENNQPLVVPDTTADARFRDNPMVASAPFIRFYAGVPLRAYDGEVIGSLCIVDMKPRAALDADDLAQLEDFASIIMAEADLRRIVAERDEARHMLERALDFSNIATWQFDPAADGLQWNGAAAQVWGDDFAQTLTSRASWFGRVHPEDLAAVEAGFGEVLDQHSAYSAEYRITHPEQGVRWIAVRADWDVRSDRSLLTGISVDITEHKNRQENSDLLMRELHHRMRNLFATVGAIISLSRNSAHDVEDYVERVSNRLDALNRAQNVLLGADFMTGSMHALLCEVQAAFPRVRWSGPDLALPENALVAMALLLNELATNAAKHGALASNSGRVEIHWTQDCTDCGKGEGERQFQLVWSESGGDSMIAEPDRTRFGTLLMERSVRNNLGGSIERRWDPSGLICTVTLPARWREA